MVDKIINIIYLNAILLLAFKASSLYSAFFDWVLSRESNISKTEFAQSTQLKHPSVIRNKNGRTSIKLTVLNALDSTQTNQKINQTHLLDLLPLALPILNILKIQINAFNPALQSSVNNNSLFCFEPNPVPSRTYPFVFCTPVGLLNSNVLASSSVKSK